MASGTECEGLELIGVVEMLGELLKGGSWKGGWQQERNVGGGEYCCGKAGTGAMARIELIEVGIDWGFEMFAVLMRSRGAA